MKLEEALWALRLAAGEIADAAERQLFLNALAEMIRLAPTGKLFDPDREQAALVDGLDPPTVEFDIGLFYRRR